MQTSGGREGRPYARSGLGNSYIKCYAIRRFRPEFRMRVVKNDVERTTRPERAPSALPEFVP